MLTKCQNIVWFGIKAVIVLEKFCKSIVNCIGIYGEIGIIMFLFPGCLELLYNW